MMIKRLASGKYEVTDQNGNVYRVSRLGENWDVREQSVKGVDHWFRVGLESRKREALRMIEDGYYAREAEYRRSRDVSYN